MKYFILIYLSVCNFTFSQENDKINYKGSLVSIENVLQKYIQFPSVSGHEKEAGDFLKLLCEENNLIINDFGNENGQYNFSASIFPLSANKPNIIFLNHIDVVPENDTFHLKPYSGEIIENKIYGRGAIDNKGVAMMQLYSIIRYLNSVSEIEDYYNVTFLAVSCEETQCDGGIKYVIENYLDLLNPIVVIGEGPSELTALINGNYRKPIFGISVAHKRTLWLNLELEINTNGHGAITPLQYANKEMINALDNLLKKKNKVRFNDLNISFLKALGDQNKGGIRTILRHPKTFKTLLVSKLRKQPELLSLFSNTITLTDIYTDNESFNKIPSKINAHLDCRLLPSTPEDEFLAEIKKKLKNDDIKIRIVSNMPETKPSSIDNIYYKNLEKAIQEKYSNAAIIPILLPNINDLGAFRAKGILSYACIPVNFTKEQVRSIHNDNENISIPLLYDGADVYFKFLNNMESSFNKKSN